MELTRGRHQSMGLWMVCYSAPINFTVIELSVEQKIPLRVFRLFFFLNQGEIYLLYNFQN